MKIDFNEEYHIYFIDGEIVTKSVTQLLKDQNLSPNYENVIPQILKSKAEYGTMIHKELENVANGLDSQNEYAKTFKVWYDENVLTSEAEINFGIKLDDYSLCGKADLSGVLKNGKTFLLDHKTTYESHKDSVTWQVNILRYLKKKMTGKDTDLLYCFWYKDNELQILQLDRIEDNIIKELINCDRTNKIFKQTLIKNEIKNETINEILKYENELYLLETAVKNKKKEVEEYRNKMLFLLKENGLKSWESPNKKIKYTLVNETTQTTVDSTALKNKYPDVFEDVKKETIKNAYIKVTLKKGE